MKTISSIIAVGILLWPSIGFGKVKLIPNPAKYGALIMTSSANRYVSGSLVPVTIKIHNIGKLPLVIADDLAARYTFLFGAGAGVLHRRVTATHHGIRSEQSLGVNIFGFPPALFIVSGKSALYNIEVAHTSIYVGRYLDMTLPGLYVMRATTKYGLYVGILQPQTLDHPHYIIIKPTKVAFLIQDGFLGAKSRLIGHKVLTSNPLRITVFAPYRKVPVVATKPSAKTTPLQSGKLSAGIHLLLTNPVANGPGPITLCVQCVDDGQSAAKVRLAGNPLVDFSEIQVTGPSFPGESTTVQKPRPHEVPYIHKNPASLTAYGQWLSKHPIKDLKRKTYVLKPDVIYNYSEPVNLSCMYDMSVSGVYRVRVKLAHTHIWSPWVNVTVP